MENNVKKEQSCSDRIIIDRRRFIKLLNKQCRLEYMLALLSAICYAAEVHYILTPEDVCDLLGIDFNAFEKVLRNNAPKSTRWDGGRVYTLESMATIAELATRPERLEKINLSTKK